MKISRANETEHAEFLSLINAEIRPDRAKTNAWDDFPLILSPKNRDCQLVCCNDEGAVVGGIACLIRNIQTSCGVLPFAGRGSVVTHPAYRGKGLSSTLQNEMLQMLRQKSIPLGVLWTDQPEIYSGRGFEPAGWEIHAQLEELRVPEGLDSGSRVRDFQPGDWPTVETLYKHHPLGVVREAGDSQALYHMPGTRGLVAEDAQGQVLAAVFCGKGADFPGYITEWDGPPELAIRLMVEARDRNWAQSVLIPPGEETMVNHLVDLGASWFCLPSGYWNILDQEHLGAILRDNQCPVPEPGAAVCGWLGGVDHNGQPLVGPLSLAIWGFDSV